MIKDGDIWVSLLVASFNISLFSYYQLGSFSFLQLGFSIEQFILSGVIIGSEPYWEAWLIKRDRAWLKYNISLISLAAGLKKR